MSDPKTLLQMAGADLSPASLSGSVVIFVDCQVEYVSGGLPLSGIEPALAECCNLLERARAGGAEIVHIAHKGKAGGAFDRDGPGGQFAGAVGPEDGEVIIEKGLPNAFAGTGLDDVIRKTGRTQLIIAGFMTHMCISSTARAALDLGYSTTIVAKATATRDLPGAGGGMIDAATLQMASLAALADRFAVIVESSGDLLD